MQLDCSGRVLERERHRLILKLTEERAVVSVAELVELLDASEATVRRDIGAMSDRGEIRRVRGGAEALTPRHRPHLVGTPLALSQGMQADQKRAIARAAAALPGPGESIIIGGGSTTYCLVEFLATRELDILTNSFPVAAHLVANSRNRITLPGGTVFREQSIVLSPFEADVTGHFWAHTMFAGCYGINSFGIMEADPLIVQSQLRLLARADRLVVMADSRKLRQRSSMVVAPLGRVSIFITDDGARAEELEPLRAAGVEVMVVPVERDGRLIDVA